MTTPMRPKWFPRETLAGLSADQVYRDAARLSQELSLDPLRARLLVLRGHTDRQSAEFHLNGDISALPDPFLLKGMQEAATRIVAAIRARERIEVMGDYDCDGTGADVWRK